MTKLDDALENGDLDYVRTFLENGGDPNTVVTTDSKKMSLLNALILVKYTPTNVFELVKLALRKGADVNGIMILPGYYHTLKLKLMKLLVEQGFDVNVLRSEGDADVKCPGMLKTEYCKSVDTLRYLLENGADINARDSCGNTILHREAYRAPMDIELLEFCDKHGFNFKAVNDFGISLIHESGNWIIHSLGDDRCLKFLLDKGLSINVLNKFGRTVLYTLYIRVPGDSIGLYSDAIQNLLTLGADPSIKDKLGETALYAHCRWEDDKDYLAKVARLFITYGLDVNSKDSLGRTVLHTSVLSCFVFDTVLEFPGIDLNATDNNGDTPLILAVKHMKVDRVRSLVNKGAKLDVANKEGKTALDVARELNATDIVTVLANKLYGC